MTSFFNIEIFENFSPLNFVFEKQKLLYGGYLICLHLYGHFDKLKGFKNIEFVNGITN